ncbi:MAG: type 1 glutamine amidotransferase [Nakamurella sp.]
MTEDIRLLAIQNDPTCPLGWLAEWFADAGVTVDVRRGYAGDTIPADLAGYRGLVVLGGDMNANDDADCPWLTPIKQLIARTISGESPFLGICLGHQLAAVAMGGKVTANPAGRALGLTHFLPTTAGVHDPLFSSVLSGSPAVQWNSDTVTEIPRGAEVVAVCADGTPQAIRFGARAWGVQFHPEVSADIFRSWLDDDDTDASPGSGAAAMPQIAAAEEALRQVWQPWARSWMALCL